MQTLIYLPSFSLPFSFSLMHTCASTHLLTLSLSLSLSLSLPFFSLSCTHVQALIYSLSPSPFLFLSHAHTCKHSFTHFLPFSFSLSLSLTHTHTHTHTYSLIHTHSNIAYSLAYSNKHEFLSNPGTKAGRASRQLREVIYSCQTAPTITKVTSSCHRNTTCLGF